MIKTLLSKLTVTLSFMLALGFAPGIGIFSNSTADAAMVLNAPSVSCGTVSTSVYAAVYSYTSGFTSCYEAANITIPDDGGQQYDLILKTSGVSEGAQVWINQGNNIRMDHISGPSVTFQYLNASQGRSLNISIIPNDPIYLNEYILTKPISSFLFAVNESTLSMNVEGNYLTNGLVDGWYAMLIVKPERMYADVRLVDASGHLLVDPDNQGQQGRLDYQGKIVFSNVPIVANMAIYAIFKGMGETEDRSYAYADGSYIGSLQTGKGIIKVRFYDEESEDNQLRIDTLDGGTKTEMSGFADFPAPNLMFIRKNLLYNHEQFEFPKWEHRIQMSIEKPAPSSPASHLITVYNEPYWEEGNQFISREMDIAWLWTVQLIEFSRCEGICMGRL